MLDFAVRAVDPEAATATVKAFDCTEHGRVELQAFVLADGDFHSLVILLPVSDSHRMKLTDEAVGPIAAVLFANSYLAVAGRHVQDELAFMVRRYLRR